MNIVRTRLLESGAFMNGHYVLANGDHTDIYICGAVFLSGISLATMIGDLLANRIRDRVGVPDFLFAPTATAAMLMGQTARSLMTLTDSDLLMIPLERTGQGNIIIKESLRDRLRGRVGWCVQDVVTSGNAITAATALVTSHGATVIGASCFLNRSGVTGRTLGLDHFEPVFDEPIPSWPARDCSLCRQNMPINTEL